MDYLLVMVGFVNFDFFLNKTYLIYLGCRQNFCSNHIIDHSNELQNRFEQIINEYNIINEIFNEYKQKSNDFYWKIIHQQEKKLNEIKLQINESQKTSK
jgi:hypothetical protein